MIQTVRAFRKVGPVHVPWLRLWSVSDFPAAKSPVALHLDTTLISPQNLFKIASIKFALAHSRRFCLLTLCTSWQYMRYRGGLARGAGGGGGGGQMPPPPSGPQKGGRQNGDMAPKYLPAQFQTSPIILICI